MSVFKKLVQEARALTGVASSHLAVARGLTSWLVAELKLVLKNTANYKKNNCK